MAKSSSLASKVSGSFLTSRLISRSSALEGTLSFSSMAFNRLVAEGFNLSVPCRIPDYNHASSPSLPIGLIFGRRQSIASYVPPRRLIHSVSTNSANRVQFRLRQSVADETGSDCATKRAECGQFKESRHQNALIGRNWEICSAGRVPGPSGRIIAGESSLAIQSRSSLIASRGGIRVSRNISPFCARS